MSTVKRFAPRWQTGMNDALDGAYVYYTSYAQLEAENARLKEELAASNLAYEMKIGQLIQQLATAQKDAERYRWLRANKPIHDSRPFIARNFGGSFSQWTNEYADNTIDAAIAAEKGEKRG